MRLIDADALLDKEGANRYVFVGIRCGKTLRDTCRNYLYTCLSNAPTIDAVPVVRCKDCKNGKTWKNAFGIEGFKCDLLCVDLSPEAFCSYGERRSE